MVLKWGEDDRINLYENEKNGYSFCLFIFKDVLEEYLDNMKYDLEEEEYKAINKWLDSLNIEGEFIILV